MPLRFEGQCRSLRPPLRFGRSARAGVGRLESEVLFRAPPRVP